VGTESGEMCELLHTFVQKIMGQNKSVTVVTVAETAAGGHPVAAPPSSVMNSRRFMPDIVFPAVQPVCEAQPSMGRTPRSLGQT
jgi:hypothetical protein